MHILESIARPARGGIGAEASRARELMQGVYRPLYLNETPILFTGLETAELIKYAANSFLALKVSFINEIADLSERLGTDVHDVARGIGLDGRIGRKFLHPGPGYGGSCFPKDTVALVRTAQEAGMHLRIVETVVEVNAARKARMAEKVIAACGGSLAGKTIAVLGLTFKPNTDDMRESASLEVVPALARAGAVVRAFDPEGMAEAKRRGVAVDGGADVRQRPDGNERDLAGMLANLAEQEFDGGRMRFRRACLSPARLRKRRFALCRNPFRDGNVRVAGFREQAIRQTGAQVGISPSRRDSDNFELGTGKRKTDGERVVDIVADVGIDDDFDFRGGAGGRGRRRLGEEGLRTERHSDGGANQKADKCSHEGRMSFHFVRSADANIAN